MEKVRFEAFNVEELRVLRRACYEAGAAFGDPGHTAAERETLDDLAVEILGELKKKMVLVHPCPKCGSIYLAHGKPYGCATPWFVAWLGSLHGVVCIACGHYKPTVIAWNREWRKKNAQ